MEVQKGAGAGENRRVREETQGESSPAQGTNLSNSSETLEIVKKHLELNYVFLFVLKAVFQKPLGNFRAFHSGVCTSLQGFY